MQDVYKDGSMGKVEDFDLDGLRKSIESPLVDHVRVFNKETGGKIEIEINDLENMIKRIVKEAMKEREIIKEFESLDKLNLGKLNFGKP